MPALHPKCSSDEAVNLKPGSFNYKPVTLNARTLDQVLKETAFWTLSGLLEDVLPEDWGL